MRTCCVIALGLAAYAAAPLARQAPAVRIVSPAADAVISGPSRIVVDVRPAEGVQTVAMFANGRLVCSVAQPPFACPWDPGPAVRGHHIRVVATFDDGRRATGNVRTKELGYTEHVRTDAVLVPVIVTRGGQFVRGLKRQDFQVLEDGVPQPIGSVISEDAPLDLVLAIDISGSMERALPQVKPAVRQLLSRLRPGDAATLVGFNETTFVVAEREKDQRARERAVELLAPWGGTALYDATIRSLQLVSREWGRKGVVIFSDGDDRDSLTRREAAMARVQASDAMLYTIGFGQGATVPRLKSSLENYARATGGRAFFPSHASELDAIFDQIVAELSAQYILSYSPTNVRQDGSWRTITVKVRSGGYDIRARRGYRASGPRQAGGDR